MSLRVKPGTGVGRYDLLDDDGNRVGHVFKKVERYNLRRMIVSTRWVLSMPGQGQSSHRTRRDAVAQAEANHARTSEQNGA